MIYRLDRFIEFCFIKKKREIVGIDFMMGKYK